MSVDDWSNPLSAAAKLGDGVLRLTLEASHAAWEGSLAGTVSIEAGSRAIYLHSLEWALNEVQTPINEYPVQGPSRRLEQFFVPAAGKWEQRFEMRLDTSVRSLGGGHEVVAVAVSKPYRETHRTRVPLEVLPPARFVRIAARLGEATGTQPGVWRLVSDGDGAEVDLSPPDRDHRGPHFRLTLFRGSACYGEMRRMARSPIGLLSAASRKIEVRFSGDEEAELVRALALIGVNSTLPIPARPAPDGDNLPRPSEPDCGSSRS